MKSLSAVLGIVAVLAINGAFGDVPVEQTCKAGDTKMDDCNSCRCIVLPNGGHGWACTKMACPHPEPARGLKEMCTVGDRTVMDCNNCHCIDLPDGKTSWACTRRTCIRPIEHTEVLEEVPADGQCTPGKVYADDCNTCTCTSAGEIGACTLKGCISMTTPAMNESCAVGDKTMIDCNHCHCIAPQDGKTSWACTRRNCGLIPIERTETLEEVPADGKCVPGKTYAQDCNTCTCTPEGKIGACSLMGCIARPRIAPLQTCRVGDSKMMDCNHCHCINTPDGQNVWACTRRMCIEMVVELTEVLEEVPVHGKCTPGRVYAQECNTCTCTDEGEIGVCTLMACISKHNLDMEESCTMGYEKMMNCNHCRCVGAVGEKPTWACTRRICAAAPPVVEKMCTVGDEKMDDCNHCHCLPLPWDQSDWACTRMACDHPVQIQARTLAPGKECHENETKALDCNHCFCANGNWACTLMGCLHTIPMCVVGDHKMEDCNSCHCVPLGGGEIGWACTEKLCLHSKLAEKDDDESCTVGESKKIDCNNCHCIDLHDNKTGWACTRMGCIHKPLEQTAILEEAPADGKCEPKKVYAQDCNTCTCTDAGELGACTMRACTPKPETGIEERCSVGDTKMMGCNECRCMVTRDGSTGWACTRMACTQKPKLMRSGEQGNECEGDETKIDDCNECVCVNGNWGCTLMGCPPKHSMDESCTVEDVTKIDCNTCRCMSLPDDKTGWACTRMGCIRPKLDKTVVLPNVPADGKCEPGKSYAQECNTCTCTAAGELGACTQKLCMPNTDMCKIGESKMMDCNNCHCIEMDDEKTEWACTRRVCPQAATTRAMPIATECTKDQTKTEDCNHCFCAGGRWACTLMACPDILGLVPADGHCEPGKIYAQGTGICTCKPSGDACESERTGSSN